MTFPKHLRRFAMILAASGTVLEPGAQLAMRAVNQPTPLPYRGGLHPSGDRGAFAKTQQQPLPPRRVVPPRPRPPEEEIETVDYQHNLRQSTEQKLTDLGVTGDWSRYSKVELEEVLLKVKASNQLKEYGANWSWYAYSLPELQYELRRRQKIKELEQKGVPLDWGKLTLADLLEIENRMKQADRVSKLGRAVDWRDHSLAEMKEMEANYYRLRRD